MPPVSAIEVVQTLIGQGLTELAVSQNMYDQLLEECAPDMPSKYFGIPITVLPGGNDATVH